MTTHIINPVRLKTIISERNWDQLLEYLKPIHFVRQESEESPNATVLAYVCQMLVDETTPDIIKILCLKCLGNSCLDSYKYKQHASKNKELDKYSEKLYIELAESNLCRQGKDCGYPHDSHFPYNGIIEWTINYITAHNKSTSYLNNDEVNIFRLSIQFLCNLFTYACKNASSIDNDYIQRSLRCNNLKLAIMNSIQSDHTLLASAACIFMHNALKELHEDYFTNDERNYLCFQLLKPIKEGLISAKDALLHILRRANVFDIIYNSMAMNEKLDLLQIIYNELWESKCETTQIDFNPIFTNKVVEFLALTFCERSDLILKTVDTYVDVIDPTEVILILDILGLFTSLSYKILENAKSLVINCKYLLMSLHMMGKESDNCFTPITNLSKVAAGAQRRTIGINSTTDDATGGTTDYDPQDHPAYGFKAGIIKVIGNMVYRNKMCQDLFREIDGIPLLLDCCNIDARNPLILQWTILALRNLCEGNLENQEIIRHCKREGLVDNPVLQEMGLTLHEDADGSSIRIAPLRRD